MKDIIKNGHILEEYKEILWELRNSEMQFKGTSKAFSTFLILWFLSKEDMHGYKIMKKIDELFEPQVQSGLMKETKANKIYPLLKEMKSNNLIEFYPGIHKKKEVKIYRLTENGEKIFGLIKKDFYFTLCRDIWVELLDDLNIKLKN